MKKVRIPLMVQDVQAILEEGSRQFVEGMVTSRSVFLDGPVTDDVAILDFDADTGELRPGVRFELGGELGYYADSQGVNLWESFRREGEPDEFRSRVEQTPEFIPVSVFGTVLRTIDQFKHDRGGEDTDHPNILGRPLGWAFDGSQLLVVPRAGEDANAFYQRASHSLQFFYAASERSPTGRVYTALSRDIVAHETGHAIIDGIAPDLCDAYTPESIAIHEALADLTAVMVAFDSNTLTHLVLDMNSGDIERRTHFSNIAEELASAVGGGRGLRDLTSYCHLNPGKPGFVDSVEPHALGEVLSSALYAILLKLYARRRQELVEEATTEAQKRQAWGRALARAATRFKQMIYRGLDYLPPGEASFATYIRAVLAADAAAYPDDTEARQWLIDEAVSRSIAAEPSDLDITMLDLELGSQRVRSLCRSDWAAHNYVHYNPALFGLSPGVSCKVYPRLEVEKVNYGHTRSHECIFKVSWSALEHNRVRRAGFPRQRRIHVGTTVVFDRESGTVKLALSSAPTDANYGGSHAQLNGAPAAEYDVQAENRDAFLQYLVDRNLLSLGGSTIGPDGHILPASIEGDIVDDVLRIHNTLNLVYTREMGDE